MLTLNPHCSCYLFSSPIIHATQITQVQSSFYMAGIDWKCWSTLLRFLHCLKALFNSLEFIIWSRKESRKMFSPKITEMNKIFTFSSSSSSLLCNELVILHTSEKRDFPTISFLFTILKNLKLFIHWFATTLTHKHWRK